MNLPAFLKNRIVRICSTILGIGAILIVIITVDVRLSYRDRIYSQKDVPSKPVIMILGASLKPDGQPSDALLDRLKVGLELYNHHKGSLVLVTGDDGKFYTDEVSVMKNYLVQAGVTSSSILVDGHGYRTYESCSRAKKEFNITQAIIVTQNFHLPRALYLCNKLGVQSVGVSADLHSYRDIIRMTLRDWLASFKAWIDINIWTPKPPV
ncbi:MAG: ElyC/SanA/YdcF family protein [Patescibacteria group bacterium]|nr:ElyC/SanA/YdcF family protein [Patescibacteria group bacterium]